MKTNRNIWLDASLAIFCIMFLSSVFFSMPTNIISTEIPDTARKTVLRIAPQGWAFFTRDPQSVYIAAYRLTSDGYDDAMITPQGRVENLWGISRRARAQGPEIAQLADEVETWTECEDPESCLAGLTASEAQHVSNNTPDPTLCGLVALAQEKPVPWSFRSFGLEKATVASASLLNIACTGGD